MSERSRSPLAELHEVEERLAVRMARIDQLQAAATSSDLRSIRFTRTLIVVAVIGALPTALLGLQQSHEWALATLLAAASATLALVTGLFSLAVRRLRSPDGAGATLAVWGLSIVARVSPRWQPFSEPENAERSGFKRGVRSRTATWLIAGAVLAICTVGVLGSLALVLFALLLAAGLLSAMWSRQASAPAAVQAAAMLVAVIAALSIGSSAGGLTRVSPWVDRHEPTRAVHGLAVPGGTRLTSAPPPASYEGSCTPTPWQSDAGGTRAKAIAELHRTLLAAGSAETGCPGAIRTAGPDTNIAFTVGSTGGQLKSLGIADPRHGILFYGPAAEMVQRLIGQRNLLAVPTHLILGGGDLYLIDTRDGTYTMIRRTEPPPGCRSTVSSAQCDASTRYVVMAPAMSTLWLAQMTRANGWLWPEPSNSIAPEQGFQLLTQDGRVIAHVSCSTQDGRCELSNNGMSYVGDQPSRAVSSEEVLRYAPTPSSPPE